jgi:hypothetical protein
MRWSFDVPNIGRVALRLTHEFEVGEDALWRALRASLPRVTAQASFWESAHRVEWSSQDTPLAWGQNFDASVQAGEAGRSVLTMSGKSQVRYSLGDRGRRAAMFETLVDGVSMALSGPVVVAADLPTEDRVMYWNGSQWTVEPPRS